MKFNEDLRFILELKLSSMMKADIFNNYCFDVSNFLENDLKIFLNYKLQNPLIMQLDQNLFMTIENQLKNYLKKEK